MHCSNSHFHSQATWPYRVSQPEPWMKTKIHNLWACITMDTHKSCEMSLQVSFGSSSTSAGHRGQPSYRSLRLPLLAHHSCCKWSPHITPASCCKFTCTRHTTLPPTSLIPPNLSPWASGQKICWGFIANPFWHLSSLLLATKDEMSLHLLTVEQPNFTPTALPLQGQRFFSRTFSALPLSLSPQSELS